MKSLSFSFFQCARSSVLDTESVETKERSVNICINYEVYLKILRWTKA